MAERNSIISRSVLQQVATGPQMARPPPLPQNYRQLFQNSPPSHAYFRGQQQQQQHQMLPPATNLSLQQQQQQQRAAQLRHQQQVAQQQNTMQLQGNGQWQPPQPGARVSISPNLPPSLQAGLAVARSEAPPIPLATPMTGAPPRTRVAKRPPEPPAPRIQLCDELRPLLTLANRDVRFLSSIGATSVAKLLAHDSLDLTRRCHAFLRRGSGTSTMGAMTEDASEIVARWTRAAQQMATTLKVEPERFKSPLSYADLRFLKSRGILHDRQILNADGAKLVEVYEKYRDEHDWAVEESASEVVKTWRRKARKELGLRAVEEDEETRRTSAAPKVVSRSSSGSGGDDTNKSREDPTLMDNVKYLCKTSPDPDTGFPQRSITAFDCNNDVLYDFVVKVRDSNIPGAGRGAFLTYKGARVVRPGVKRRLRRAPPHPTRTRQPREAFLPDAEMGVTVTLKGTNLHGDEHLFGSDRGVGAYRDLDPDRDFIPSPDNVTFRSRDDGSGLVELGRYAPLLREDRKTELVFAVKDFVFSYEPSGWRFDVPEELHGYSQVVDFTDDVTGEPHGTAIKNVPMYVNEVGHNPSLTQNVVSRDDYRSVSYYLLLEESSNSSSDASLHKGQTFELLVHYLEGYEEMRERKGYGRANFHGTNPIKCDRDDHARLGRNLKERAAMERHIQTYNAQDIERVLSFIEGRVLRGVIEDTNKSLLVAASGGANVSAADATTESSDGFGETILRQWVARRRLHWIGAMMKSQLEAVSLRYRVDDEEVESSTGDTSSPTASLDDGPANAFRRGQFVFVNGWLPPDDARPEYTGIAAIDAFKRDPESLVGGIVYDLVLEGNKYIRSVPEGALTHPTDEDLDGASKRIQTAWKKWKEKDDWAPKYRRMLDVLRRMEWESAHGDAILSRARTQGKALKDAMDEELSEEALYTLAKRRYLLNPYCIAEWCHYSTALLRQLLKYYTTLRLSSKTNSSSGDLRSKFLKTLMKRAVDASRAIRKHAAERQKTMYALAFMPTAGGAGAEAEPSVAVMDPTSPGGTSLEGTTQAMLPVERFMKGEGELHVSWYLVTQVIAVVDAIASLVTWGAPASGSAGAEYSFRTLCESVGVNASTAHSILREARDRAARTTKVG